MGCLKLRAQAPSACKEAPRFFNMEKGTVPFSMYLSASLFYSPFYYSAAYPHNLTCFLLGESIYFYQFCRKTIHYMLVSIFQVFLCQAFLCKHFLIYAFCPYSPSLFHDFCDIHVFVVVPILMCFFEPFY